MQSYTEVINERNVAALAEEELMAHNWALASPSIVTKPVAKDH